MSLKQLSHEQRIKLLIEFVGNIVVHSTEDERLKKLIKVERLKRKILPEPEPNIDHIGKSVIFEKPVEKLQKSIHINPVKPTFHLQKVPQKIMKTPRPIMTPQLQHNLSSGEVRSADEIMIEINKLIEDKNVQMIECPGPGKKFLVKVRNRVNMTKLTLNEGEIKNVIAYFSDYARIPIVGGILKTSVDQLMISAVISEYAGSRFIINKRNPYDLIG